MGFVSIKNEYQRLLLGEILIIWSFIAKDLRRAYSTNSLFPSLFFSFLVLFLSNDSVAPHVFFFLISFLFLDSPNSISLPTLEKVQIQVSHYSHWRKKMWTQVFHYSYWWRNCEYKFFIIYIGGKVAEKLRIQVFQLRKLWRRKSCRYKFTTIHIGRKANISLPYSFSHRWVHGFKVTLHDNVQA